MSRSVPHYVLLTVAIVATLGMTVAARSQSFGGPINLRGPMIQWQQMVGVWKCTVHIDSLGDQEEQTGVMVLIAWAAPGNVFHTHVSAAGYEVDDFIGYSEREKAWWEVSADSAGNATLMRSTDGRVFDQVSHAASSPGIDNGKRRLTYEAVENSSFTQFEEEAVHGTWRASSEMRCQEIKKPSGTGVHGPAGSSPVPTADALHP